jgi:hypothetical protein
MSAPTAGQQLEQLKKQLTELWQKYSRQSKTGKKKS